MTTKENNNSTAKEINKALSQVVADNVDEDDDTEFSDYDEDEDGDDDEDASLTEAQRKEKESRHWQKYEAMRKRNAEKKAKMTPAQRAIHRIAYLQKVSGRLAVIFDDWKVSGLDLKPTVKSLESARATIERLPRDWKPPVSESTRGPGVMLSPGDVVAIRDDKRDMKMLKDVFTSTEMDHMTVENVEAGSLVSILLKRGSSSMKVLLPRSYFKRVETPAPTATDEKKTATAKK